MLIQMYRSPVPQIQAHENGPVVLRRVEHCVLNLGASYLLTVWYELHGRHHLQDPRSPQSTFPRLPHRSLLRDNAVALSRAILVILIWLLDSWCL